MRTWSILMVAPLAALIACGGDNPTPETPAAPAMSAEAPKAPEAPAASAMVPPIGRRGNRRRAAHH
jgi:hypothetical protein